MDAPAHQRFATELTVFFPRVRPPDAPVSPDDRLPSWLASGVWPQTTMDRAALDEQRRDVAADRERKRVESRESRVRSR
jgi:hypothetical protein